MTPLTATRTVAKLADPAAVDALLAPLPSPLHIRATVINASGQRHMAQYDARAGVMHYVAANGVNAVRLSVKGLSEQQAPLAVLTAHEVLTLSAQEVANAFGRLFRHPAVVGRLDDPSGTLRGFTLQPMRDLKP